MTFPKRFARFGNIWCTISQDVSKRIFPKMVSNKEASKLTYHNELQISLNISIISKNLHSRPLLIHNSKITRLYNFVNTVTIRCLIIKDYILHTSHSAKIGGLLPPNFFCRFWKCKRKVPPLSLLSNNFEKSCCFSKILVTFFFSLTKIFQPYKDFCPKFYVLECENKNQSDLKNFLVQ